MKKIAFMGAGAIRSYLGAFLTRVGYDPVLIDPWAEHIDYMRKNGLHVTGTQREFTAPVKTLQLGDVQSVREPFDIVFIAMKSYDTEWSATFMKPYLSPAGCMVSAQNSINDEIIASVVGYPRAVGCTISAIAVALEGPPHRSGLPERVRGTERA